MPNGPFASLIAFFGFGFRPRPSGDRLALLRADTKKPAGAGKPAARCGKATHTPDLERRDGHHKTHKTCGFGLYDRTQVRKEILAFYGIHNPERYVAAAGAAGTAGAAVAAGAAVGAAC